MSSNLRKLTKEALSKSVTPEQLSSFESALRDNMSKAGEQADRSLLLCITLTVTWILVRNAYIPKISLLDIEIGNPDIALLIIPPIAAFAYYQYQCFGMLTDYIDTVLRELYAHKFPPFVDSSLDELLIHPTFVNIENALSNLSSGFISKTSFGWALTVYLLMNLSITVFLLWISYSLIVSPVLGIGWSILSSVTAALVVVRSLLMLINSFTVL